MSKEKYAPQERYRDKVGMVQIKMNVSPKTEKDILDKLESVPNKAGYIKQLIREDIARQKSK